MDFSFLATLASRADLSLLRKWTVFYRKGIFSFERAFYPQYAILFPSHRGRIHSPGPSGLAHATSFPHADLLLHEWTFVLDALRARISFYVTSGTLHIANGHCHFRAGGSIPHYVRVYSRRTHTDLIHCRTLSGSVFNLRRRLISITRRPLPAKVKVTHIYFCAPLSGQPRQLLQDDRSES